MHWKLNLMIRKVDFTLQKIEQEYRSTDWVFLGIDSINYIILGYIYMSIIS
jgi:hypothetical protein